MSTITIDWLARKKNDLAIETLDMSYGEILSLIRNEELVIEPDYQRLFRWDFTQQSRFIESVMLRIPIPQIFTVERSDGVLELTDGLQRISTMIHFFGRDELDNNEKDKEIYRNYFPAGDLLTLSGCEVLKELNEKTVKDFSVRDRLTIKRSSIRMVIVKRQSDDYFRYELFKRLNTGGTPLSAQEIRNCSSRMIGEDGSKFYNFLIQCAKNKHFQECTDSLSDKARGMKEDEELVLRFFALKNARDDFKGSVRDWLDQFMEDTILEKHFDYEQEGRIYGDLFERISTVLGQYAFVKHRDDKPIGGLAPAFFEAVTMGLYENVNNMPDVTDEELKNAIIAAIQSQEFKDNTGPGANTRNKLCNRINIVRDAVRSLKK